MDSGRTPISVGISLHMEQERVSASLAEGLIGESCMKKENRGRQMLLSGSICRPLFFQHAAGEYAAAGLVRREKVSFFCMLQGKGMLFRQICLGLKADRPSRG